MAAKSASPPPAYFLSLSLENVRSFGEKQTIYFTEGGKEGGKPAQWTVILGDNGVGKTTVLKALAAMVTEDRPIDGRNPDIAAMWRLANSGWSPNRWDTLSADLETEVAQDQELQSGKIGKNFQVVESYVGKTNGAGMMSRGRNPRSLVCYGYGASRTTGNSALSETPETVDTCASLFDDRADLLDPQEWFLNIDYGIRLSADDQTKHKQLSDANDRVRQMLKDVLPGVTDLRIVNNGTPQKPQISLQLLLNGMWVRLRDMSLGYQTLVMWLTDFASKLYVRYPESDNPLAEPAIVLIDEIDLHLHPKWQRELLRVLSDTFKKTQFIATAHSPLVVQAAGDVGANVVLLRREGDQTIVCPHLEDVRNWRYDQILTSELFGLDTARSLAAEQKLQERTALLTKAKLTAAEKKQLKALTDELDVEPVGETASEREVNAVLQELRERLTAKRSEATGS